MKRNILVNAKKLKGTKIYINEDLSEGSLAKRNAQLPQLKQARSQGKIAFFNHTKLIIKEKVGLQNPVETETTVGASGSTPLEERPTGGAARLNPTGSRVLQPPLSVHLDPYLIANE